MSVLRLDEQAVSWTEVDGEILALEHKSSTYISTNGAGAILWNSLATGTSREQLIGAVMRTFGVSETTAATDIDAFVDALARRGLLAT